MKNVWIIISLLVLSCQSELKEEEVQTNSEGLEQVSQGIIGPVCPKNHQDSIVPIVYGYPGEELWAKSDSGLVAIGGCEIGPEENFCKIHQIRF